MEQTPINGSAAPSAGWNMRYNTVLWLGDIPPALTQAIGVSVVTQVSQVSCSSVAPLLCAYLHLCTKSWMTTWVVTPNSCDCPPLFPGVCPEPGGVRFSSRTKYTGPYNPGSDVTYRCNDGEVATITCQRDGEWTQKPSCKALCTFLVTQKKKLIFSFLFWCKFVQSAGNRLFFLQFQKRPLHTEEQ